jgi:tryptophan synthase alpha chain
VSRTGVTGERKSLEETLGAKVATIRRYTSQPVAVGFGISTPEHTREVAVYADAVVVGSAIVRRIAERQGDPDLVSHIGVFVEELVQPLKGAPDGS